MFSVKNSQALHIYFNDDIVSSITEYDLESGGNKTAYEYDDSGRTTKVTSKDANGTELAHVSYAYDTFDNMTEIVREHRGQTQGTVRNH